MRSKLCVAFLCVCVRWKVDVVAKGNINSNAMLNYATCIYFVNDICCKQEVHCIQTHVSLEGADDPSLVFG